MGLSFAVTENEAYYVAIPANRQEALEYVDIFKPLYEDPEILKIGQNIKYDYMVLRNYGVDLQGRMFDTMLAHYVIQPELQHNMDYMAETLLNYQTVHIEELIGPKGKNQKNMRDLSPQEVYEYAAEDADITLQLKNVLEPRLKEVGAERLFWDIEMPLVKVLADMELNGVRLDTQQLKLTQQTFTERMNAYERHAYEEAGETFNIASPKQVGDILFGKMQLLEKPKRTKTGQYVTSEEVLQQLRGKAPIVDDILNYRGMKNCWEPTWRPCPSLSTSEPDTSTRRSTKPSPPQDDCHRRIPTCKTSLFATTMARRYASVSYPMRDADGSLPTTVRSNCASWPTFRPTRT